MHLSGAAAGTAGTGRVSILYMVFCNSLLKENPVEAGLDPAFQVAEEVEMDEFLLRTVQQFVKQDCAAVTVIFYVWLMNIPQLML